MSLEQLLALGFAESWIKRAASSGRLTRVYRGVCAYGHPSGRLQARTMAAQLAMGPDAVVSHRTAAALLGIRPEHPGPIEVTLPNWRRNRPGIRAHESRSLTPDDVRIWYGIRVTNVKRTLVDLADVLTADELESALSEAHRLGLIDRATTRFPHDPGRKGLAAVLKRGARMTRSQIERRFLRDLRKAGDVPLPLTNHRMHGFEADCYWPDHALVVEIDDYRTHGDRLAFERDRRKQTAYTLVGLRLLRITEETLPGAVETVRTAMATRR